MTAPVDLRPAARTMADLVRGIPDGMLGAPTPCPAYSLGDLVDHVGGLALAFTAAAAKDTGATAAQGPSGDASRLGDDWRERIPADLERLAAAWQDPVAWQGMTQAGGLDLPGDIAGLVVLDELVIHGWDVARASGQRFACDPGLLEVVHQFVDGFAEPGQEAARDGLFGPVVEVPDDAALLDRVLGLTGRAPTWAPPPGP
ncbi:MAG: TIGR03086 family protein [Acidimicrobiales bacterium]|nr:TIGR03086 family protein [Acidimicrobiales bacterium]